MTRKLREWWLAPVIYHELTRGGDLTPLKQWAANHIWLAQRTGGAPLHGVEITSRVVFGKEAKDLTIAEQFVLASAVNKPIILLPGSEKLNDAQLELLELEPGVSQAEVQAESVREPLPPQTRTQRQRLHPGRQELPANLPRVERVIECAPEQCQCSHCGQATKVIGYETSEQLDVEPAKYFVLVTKREKRACPHCEQGGVDRKSVV